MRVEKVHRRDFVGVGETKRGGVSGDTERRARLSVRVGVFFVCVEGEIEVRNRSKEACVLNALDDGDIISA